MYQHRIHQYDTNQAQNGKLITQKGKWSRHVETKRTDATRESRAKRRPAERKNEVEKKIKWDMSRIVPRMLMMIMGLRSKRKERRVPKISLVVGVRRCRLRRDYSKGSLAFPDDGSELTALRVRRRGYHCLTLDSFMERSTRLRRLSQSGFRSSLLSRRGLLICFLFCLSFTHYWCRAKGTIDRRCARSARARVGRKKKIEPAGFLVVVTRVNVRRSHPSTPLSPFSYYVHLYGHNDKVSDGWGTTKREG